MLSTIIELQTNCETPSLCMSAIEKFGDGSGYRCNLRVQSGHYSYDGPFYFEHHFLGEAILSIRLMMTGKPGEAVVRSNFEKEELRFQMNLRGHVAVKGFLIEYGMANQSLKFEFITDQTVFHQLLRDLVEIYEA